MNTEIDKNLEILREKVFNCILSFYCERVFLDRNFDQGILFINSFMNSSRTHRALVDYNLNN